MRFCFAIYFLSLIHVQAELSKPEILRIYVDPALQVVAGGQVVVNLTLMDSRRNSWLGSAKEEFDFYIISQPQQGRLSAVQQFSRNSSSDQARVIYTPNQDAKTVDSFSFEARDRKGLHRLAGIASISILQARLDIVPVTGVVFDNIMVGEEATYEIQLKNLSEVKIRGQLSIDRPFLISDEEYELLPRAQKKVKIRCFSQKPGFYRVPLRLSSHPSFDYWVEASVLSPLIFLPERLNLGTQIRQTGSIGEIELHNRSQSEQTIQLYISPPFQLITPMLTIPAQSKRNLELRADPLLEGNFNREIIARAGSLVAKAQIQLKWLRESPSKKQIVALPNTNILSIAKTLVKPNVIYPASLNVTQLSIKTRLPELSLMGLFYRILEQEVAVIKWKSSEDPSLYRLSQKQWQWNEDKSKLIETWQPVEDVSCESFDKTMIGFRVDRLQPNWSYTFAVYQMDEKNQILTMSKPIFIVTPAVKAEVRTYIWVWWALGLGMLGGLIWFLKNIVNGWNRLS